MRIRGLLVLAASLAPALACSVLFDASELGAGSHDASALGDDGTAPLDAGGGGVDATSSNDVVVPDDAPPLGDVVIDAPNDAPPGYAVTGFALIDTTKLSKDGVPIAGFDPLVNGATFDAGPALSVKAKTSPTNVGSVEMRLDGVLFSTQNSYPYSLCGDGPTDGGGPNQWDPCTFTSGQHTVTAVPYTGASFTGSAGQSASVSFTVR